MKSLRSEIDGTIGSQFTVDLLSAIESAPNDLFETPLMQVIDYYWSEWQNVAIALNSIYVCYPIIITVLIEMSVQDLFSNRAYVLFFSLILILLELYQIYIEGPSTYFT